MASCETDERYTMAESEHVDRLRDCDIRDIGLLVGDSPAGLGDWKTLAGKLGVSNDDVRRIETTSDGGGGGGDRRVVPGEEVLKLWRRKEQSTIRVLRQVLGEMNRDDVIRRLDDMRLNMVSFPIVLMRDGREIDVLRIKCPGRKPLIEHVRPLLTCRLDVTSVEHGRRIVVQLRVTDVVKGVKANWSSPAELFQAQQVILMLKFVRPTALERKSTPSGDRGRRADVIVQQRNVISWLMDDETLVFGYPPLAEPSAESHVEAHAEAADAASWSDGSSSSSSQLEDSDKPHYENDIDERQELREARRLDGFHDIEPCGRKQAVSELLSPYLGESGRYILRKSTTCPDVVLAISVTHNQQIVHYYVLSKRERSGVLYTVRVKEGYRWDSLRSLLDHYHHHPIEHWPNGDALLLTAPVVDRSS